jgi:hypothetical protein
MDATELSLGVSKAMCQQLTRDQSDQSVAEKAALLLGH